MERRTLLGSLPILLLGRFALAAREDDKSVTKLDGIVRYYEPGERIGIDIRPEVEQTYNLKDEGTTYKLDPNLAVGSKVQIEDKKDASGRKTVTIRLSS